MAKRTYTTLVFLAILLAGAKAQTDTLGPPGRVIDFDSLLLPKRLGYTDIHTPLTRQSDRIKIISGSRFPIESDDLPYSVYVITKEEIRQNGYETLVDALKMAPGIRVSQPGNAIEGETFLMRGFLGNTYAKILINDVPIKPIFVGGMPIGAQLPIKEAERIEVIYGAGAALYGGDANAGVINIITRQSEKPVFMQADLSAGQGLYSSVSVMFGARLGKDKRIFNLFAYGSNVLLERRNIFYDLDYNYLPATYFRLGGEDSTFTRYRNYAGTYNRPLLTNTPHLSRKFGLTLNYKGTTLSVESMYRRDHSALGLNPVAVSYSNPFTYTGEGIWRANLNFYKSKPKRNTKTDITYLHYRLDNRSSVLYVQNYLSRIIYDATAAEANRVGTDRDSIYREAYNGLFDGQRYLYATSDEIRLEHVRNYRILKRFSLTAGANVKAGGGIPFTSFIARPVDKGDIELDTISFEDSINGVLRYDPSIFPVGPELQLVAEFNAFGQLLYSWKRFNIIGGVYYSTIAGLAETGLSPRLAGLWKLTENIRVRASWGQSFRSPGAYYNAISYQVRSDTIGHPLRDLGSLEPGQTAYLEPERTTSLEGGFRWNIGDYIRLDATWFSNRTSNLVRYADNREIITDTLSQRFLGYQNDSAFETRLKGGQLHLQVSNILSNNLLEAQYNFTWSKATKKEQFFIEDLYREPNYEGQIHQLRLFVRPGKRNTFILDGLWVRGLDEQLIDGQRTNKFFTLDATYRFAFTDRFNVYMKATNVFNKKYPGIRATGTFDDLQYNPQNGIFFRLGMNYFVE
ncbi:MAG: TonB-dependent receptor [Lewinellaceae bacterium]|nr:TonB-dependent receptor [Saprospiraceae bacterium]MCB9338668.1 TonB-dependent receptor [Lewinellaceae bacterium]